MTRRIHSRQSLGFALAFGVTAILGAAAHADTYDLTWNTIDGGGATFSSGGGYTLGGTIGQPDAGEMAGGGYSLRGGFWPGALTTPGILAGDMNCDGLVNNFDIDPFVLALVTPQAYVLAFPNCNILNGDVDHSGTLTNFDIDPFVVCLVNFGCP